MSDHHLIRYLRAALHEARLDIREAPKSERDGIRVAILELRRRLAGLNAEPLMTHERLAA